MFSNGTSKPYHTLNTAPPGPLPYPGRPHPGPFPTLDTAPPQQDDRELPKIHIQAIHGQEVDIASYGHDVAIACQTMLAKPHNTHPAN